MINLRCTPASPCRHLLPDGSAHQVGIAGYNVNREQVRLQEGDLRRDAIPVELCTLFLGGAILAQDLNEQRELEERERQHMQARARTVRNPQVVENLGQDSQILGQDFQILRQDSQILGQDSQIQDPVEASPVN